MRQIILRVGLALLLAGATRAQETTTPIGDALADQVTHTTVTVVRDITDPEHPVEIARTSNAIGGCGVRNMLAVATTGTGSTMGGSGTAGTLGQFCQGGGLTAAAMIQHDTAIVVGAAGPETCTSGNTPFKCCTGPGAGCGVPSSLDIITFTEGQPNNSLASVQANYTAWGGSGNFYVLPLDGPPSLVWDGANMEGVQFSATAGISDANGFKWCEYAVRTCVTASGITTASSSFPCIIGNNNGGLTLGGSTRNGWQLNHGTFTGQTSCTGPVKSGSVWQIIVTIYFT